MNLAVIGLPRNCRSDSTASMRD